VKLLIKTPAVFILGLLIQCGVTAQTQTTTQSVKPQEAPQIDVNARFQSLGSTTPISLADYQGKVVVVALWASWCPACVMAVNGLVELEKEFADRGIQVIALSIEDPQKADTDVRRLVAGFPPGYKVGWISTISADRWMTRKGIVPQIFVIRDGVVLRSFQGWHATMTVTGLRKALDEAQKKKTAG
jgi:thiol-disulfide isomerase/thioredoxin